LDAFYFSTALSLILVMGVIKLFLIQVVYPKISKNFKDSH